MADYNKQTVAQLRQILKDRGIPSTGLTRKGQIIEKLEEADGALETPNAPTEPTPQVEEVSAKQAIPEPEVPGPALAKAGGNYIPKDFMPLTTYQK